MLYEVITPSAVEGCALGAFGCILFISTEKYTSISIQKYTNFICITTPCEAFAGYPAKASQGVRIFLDSP